LKTGTFGMISHKYQEVSVVRPQGIAEKSLRLSQLLNWANYQNEIPNISIERDW
jgi:hypothetical protein